MKKLIMAFLVIMIATVSFATPEAPTAENIKEVLSKHFTNFRITDVTESEIKGLYEVEASGNIMYSDGEYILMGHIFDFSGKDITQEKINGLVAKAAAGIDKSIAIRIGHGKKEVIEFSDPECPYCLKAEAFFKGADVSRYVFFYPLPFHPNAERLSIDIACAGNPEDEYHKVIDAVIAGHASDYKVKTCEGAPERLSKMKEAAEKMNLRGTPLFIIDGQVIVGADPKIQQLIK